MGCCIKLGRSESRSRTLCRERYDPDTTYGAYGQLVLDGTFVLKVIDQGGMFLVFGPTIWRSVSLIAVRQSEKMRPFELLAIVQQLERP